MSAWIKQCSCQELWHFEEIIFTEKYLNAFSFPLTTLERWNVNSFIDSFQISKLNLAYRYWVSFDCMVICYKYLFTNIHKHIFLKIYSSYNLFAVMNLTCINIVKTGEFQLMHFNWHVCIIFIHNCVVYIYISFHLDKIHTQYIYMIMSLTVLRHFHL